MIEMPLEDAIRRSTETFSVFGFDREAREAAEMILASHSADGIYRFEATNSIRVSIWRPLKK